MSNRTVSIVTDSACDITPQLAASLNVTVVPLNVIFQDETLQDGKDIAPIDFYERMEKSGQIPSTSQPAPLLFQQAFQEKIDANQDVICITISSKISGTFQSANVAKEMFSSEERQHIHIFDSYNLCVGELLLVQTAATMASKGITASIIMDTLKHLQPRVRTVAMFSTLENLRKGGRIPAGVAFAGKALSIKPVITVEKGKISMVGIAKGSKKGKNLLEKAIKKFGGVDYDRPIQFGYTGLTDQLLRTYLKENEALYGSYSDSLPVIPVGAVIGAHAGPGAIAVAFFSRK